MTSILSAAMRSAEQSSRRGEEQVPEKEKTHDKEMKEREGEHLEKGAQKATPAEKDAVAPAGESEPGQKQRAPKGAQTAAPEKKARAAPVREAGSEEEDDRTEPRQKQRPPKDAA